MLAEEKGRAQKTGRSRLDAVPMGAERRLRSVAPTVIFDLRRQYAHRHPEKGHLVRVQMFQWFL